LDARRLMGCLHYPNVGNLTRSGIGCQSGARVPLFRHGHDLMSALGHFRPRRALQQAPPCRICPHQDSCRRVGTSGMPVRLALTTGEAHENRLVLTLLSALKSGAMLLADRGFDADWIRTFVSEHGAWANIPPRRNRTEPICFSPHLYRARNLVDRFFNKIKQCRRVATRYDKLAANYLAFIELASIRLWLRVNESTP
jgi:transposase